MYTPFPEHVVIHPSPPRPEEFYECEAPRSPNDTETGEEVGVCAEVRKWLVECISLQFDACELLLCLSLNVMNYAVSLSLEGCTTMMWRPPQ